MSLSNFTERPKRRYTSATCCLSASISSETGGAGATGSGGLLGGCGLVEGALEIGAGAVVGVGAGGLPIWS